MGGYNLDGACYDLSGLAPMPVISIKNQLKKLLIKKDKSIL